MQRWSSALILAVLAVSAAQGHFVWIVPAQQDGLVLFSDSLAPDRAELLAKIAQTQWQVRRADGKTEKLKWTEAKEAPLLRPGGQEPCQLAGVCQYGVIQKGTAPFLLNYYASALVGGPLASAPDRFLEPWDLLPLQVIPVKGPAGKFRVLWQGKPLADAEVALVIPGKDQGGDTKTDASGTVSLPLEGSKNGLYGLRARHVEAKKGQLDGKEYVEVRHYATLVVQAEGGKAAAEPKEDPAASKLLKDARAARARWDGFPGFTADVAVNFDGQVHKGKVRVEANGKVHLDGLPPAVEPWARRNLGSTVSHRLDDAASRNTPCAFLDDNTTHPLGRAIRVLNDELHSSYRVRDLQITEVNRVMQGGKFTIRVLENRLNAEGKFLSVSFVVHFLKPETSELARSEAHHQTWTRLGKFDLPAQTTVISAGGEPSSQAQSITLTNHQLTAGK